MQSVSGRGQSQHISLRSGKEAAGPSGPFIHRACSVARGVTFVQKAGLFGLFSEGLIIGGNFAFQNGLDLTIKTA